MADVALVSRALNKVQTIGQAKLAIGEALNEIGRAYKTAKISDDAKGWAADSRILDRVRLPLEAWFTEISGRSDASNYRAEFLARRDLVTRAYVETFGILGEIQARGTVSLLNEIGTGFEALPGQAGAAIGGLARGVGETAGGILGGVFSGLGPLLTILVVVVLFFYVSGRIGALKRGN